MPLVTFVTSVKVHKFKKPNDVFSVYPFYICTHEVRVKSPLCVFTTRSSTISISTKITHNEQKQYLVCYAKLLMSSKCRSVWESGSF